VSTTPAFFVVLYSFTLIGLILTRVYNWFLFLITCFFTFPLGGCQLLVHVESCCSRNDVTKQWKLENVNSRINMHATPGLPAVDFGVDSSSCSPSDLGDTHTHTQTDTQSQRHKRNWLLYLRLGYTVAWVIMTLALLHKQLVILLLLTVCSLFSLY